jgi:hypothetical protein
MVHLGGSVLRAKKLLRTKNMNAHSSHNIATGTTAMAMIVLSTMIEVSLQRTPSAEVVGDADVEFQRDRQSAPPCRKDEPRAAANAFVIYPVK